MTDRMSRWDGGYGHMSGGDWWWAGFMMLFWAAVLVLLIWAVIRLSRAIESRRDADARPPEPAASPRVVLDRLYATGAIDSATYEERRARIEGDRPPP